MMSNTLKISSSLLLSALTLSGCSTLGIGGKAPHLLEPVTPRTTPVFDTLGTAYPTFTQHIDKPVNGQQKLLPYLPYVIPASDGSRRYMTDNGKYSTYITSTNGKPNALLYDDAREAMALTEVSKSSKTTTTAQLGRASTKSINKIVSSLESKYSVELVNSNSGYNQHKFNQQNHPYTTKRYLVTSKDKAVTVSAIRDDLLSAMYDRPTNPQSGIETHVLNKVFYVDLATWSDLKTISGIHMSLWVHPVNFNDSAVENKWIDDHKRYITSDAFIHFE